MKRKIAAAMLLVTAAVCAAIQGGAHLAMSSQPTETPVKARLTQVTQGTVEQTLRLSGRIRGEQEFAAIWRQSGIIEEVFVGPGDRVKAGQALARLSGSAQESAMTQAMRAESLAGETELWPGAESAAAMIGQSQAERAARAVEDLIVRAPGDGVILQGSASVYCPAIAGEAAFTLTGDAREIRCSVAARDAAKVQAGMNARIYASGEALCQAQVRSVGPALPDSLTGQMTAQVCLCPDTAVTLPVGTPVEAEVILCGGTDVTVLPAQAVNEAGKVWWVCDGRGYEVDAGVVMEDGERCWVLLPEGISVVLDAGGTLVNGQRIKETRP